MKTTIVYHQPAPVLCVPAPPQAVAHAASHHAYPPGYAPTVVVTQPSAAGWHVVAPLDFVHLAGICSKLGFWVASWKRRWFVLDGTYLTYYTSNRKRQRGTILLRSILAVHEVGSELRIVTKFRTYRLRVPDGSTAPWARALQHNIRALCLRDGQRPAQPLFRPLVCAVPCAAPAC